MVGYLCGAYRVSERHACEVVLLPRATHRYQSIRDPLTALRLRMRELAQTRIRYGYRKIRVLLIREGWQVGKKLVYRLYREEGLGLRARRKSRRTVSEHSRQKPRAERPNQVWGLDFVADQLIDGRRFRALDSKTIMDRSGPILRSDIDCFGALSILVGCQGLSAGGGGTQQAPGVLSLGSCPSILAMCPPAPAGR